MHPSPQDFMSYRLQRMSPEEILRFRQHIDVCEECRSQLAPEAGYAAALRALFSTEPDEQELVLYAAGKLPEEVASSIREHARECAACAEAIEDLKRSATRGPATPFTVVNGIGEAKRRGKLWWIAVPAAAAACVVGIFVLRVHTVAAPRPVLASLHDGARTISLAHTGELTGLADTGDLERAWVADALRSGRVAGPPAIEAGVTGVLRGASDGVQFQLVAPVNCRIASDRPEFGWEALGGAREYEIAIFTADEKVVVQGVVKENRWQPSRPLPRETRLGWQVTARRAGRRITVPVPPAPRVYFEVISVDGTARLERAIALKPASHLLVAVVSARQGLMEQARQEIDALDRENPASIVVEKLRSSISLK
jgi:hypothetical protein